MPIKCKELSPCVPSVFIINVTTAKVKAVSSSKNGTINIIIWNYTKYSLTSLPKSGGDHSECILKGNETFLEGKKKQN